MMNYEQLWKSFNASMKGNPTWEAMNARQKTEHFCTIFREAKKPMQTPIANNNNSVFNYESINQQARAALNGNIHKASSAVTPAPTSTVTRAAVELSDEALYTGMHVADDGVGAALRGAGYNMPAPSTQTASTVWNWYDNGTEMIPYRDQADLQRILSGEVAAPGALTANPTASTGSSTTVQTVFNNGKYEVRQGDTVLRSFEHKTTADRYGTYVLRNQAPLGDVTAQQVQSVASDIADETAEVIEGATQKLTPEAQKALQMAEDASKPFSTTATQINQNLGIGTVDREADLLRRQLAVQESGGRSAFRDISREWTGRSKALAEQADDVAKVIDKTDDAAKVIDKTDDVAKVIDKTDDVAKGINWGKVGKWALIGVGVAALAGLAAWGISKLCKKDEPQVQETPEDETVVPEPTPEPETPVTPEPPVIPEPPVAPEIPTEYTAEAGNSIWHIAERYLKDKYANEPEKFENLTTSEKNRMITAETIRIAKLNDYELVEKIVNGRKDIYPNPTIHIGDKVKVQ